MVLVHLGLMAMADRPFYCRLSRNRTRRTLALSEMLTSSRSVDISVWQVLT